MRNSNLLRFLGAVEEHGRTASTLMALTGYDPLELQVATGLAMEHEFVECTGEIHPSLILTAAARTWMAEQIADLTGAPAPAPRIVRAA